MLEAVVDTSRTPQWTTQQERPPAHRSFGLDPYPQISRPLSDFLPRQLDASVSCHHAASALKAQDGADPQPNVATTGSVRGLADNTRL